MRIDHYAALRVLVALIRAPNLCEAKKESLLRRETVDFLLRFFGMFRECFLQREVGNLKPTDVRDIFALG